MRVHISAKWNNSNITTTTATRPTAITTHIATTPYNEETGGRRKSRKLSPRLSGTVIKIWHLKDNEVATLIFQGHVTSSVTWLFDSRWSTSYGWSIATMRLSGTVIEIWRLKMHVHTLTHTQTDRTTNLLISSNVHFVHLGGDNKLQTFVTGSNATTLSSFLYTMKLLWREVKTPVAW